MKPCKVCGREFPLVDYRLTVRGQLWPDGRSNWCEECIRTSEVIRDGGFGGHVSELKSLVRASVLGLGVPALEVRKLWRANVNRT